MRVLDTCVLSSFAHPQAPQHWPCLNERVGAILLDGLTLSHVTVYELRRGLEEERIRAALRNDESGRIHAVRKRAVIEKLIEDSEVLGLDESAGAGWELAADLCVKARTHSPSITLEEADLLIAATACSSSTAVRDL
jgi:predicted nucleic acid-binding protein